MPSRKALDAYEDRADALSARYDAVTADEVLLPVADFLPPPPAPCLDVGPGSGRDAAWLAARGHAVTVAEPTASFREMIAQRVPDATIVDAKLPDLPEIEGPFALVLANLVWHHLAPDARTRAFARIADLLEPGGRLILCQRCGPAMPEWEVWALDTAEETARAEAAGLRLLHQADAPPRGPEEAEAGVTATWLVFERTAE